MANQLYLASYQDSSLVNWYEAELYLLNSLLALPIQHDEKAQVYGEIAFLMSRNAKSQSFWLLVSIIQPWDDGEIHWGSMFHATNSTAKSGY